MTVPIAEKIPPYDIVELTAPAGGAPAGEQGGVLDIFDGEEAMVELTSMPPELTLERIVMAPLDKLRVIDPASRRNGR